MGFPFISLAEMARVLIVVKPENVVRGHRRGIAFYWTRVSKHHAGRPSAGNKIRHLTREMANANPIWGSPRNHGELLKFGIKISEMPRREKTARTIVSV